jgi:hypothetical protein
MRRLLLKVMRSNAKLPFEKSRCDSVVTTGTSQVEMGTFDVAQARSARVPRMPRPPINHGRYF